MFLHLHTDFIVLVDVNRKEVNQELDVWRLALKGILFSTIKLGKR